MPEQRSWVEVKPYSEFKSTDVKKMTHFQEALWKDGVITPVKGKHLMKWFYIFVGSPYFNGTKHSYKVFWVSAATVDKPAKEMEIVDASMRWTHCPLCERLTVGGDFRQLRDMDGQVLQEQVFCEYCSMEERCEGEVRTHDGYRTWCTIDVFTTRIGYILGSPRLMRGYKAARRFKAPRRRS